MEKAKGKDVIINIPVKLRYYLDPLAILVATVIICGIIIYVGRLVNS